MITLEDIQNYETLEKEIKDFLVDRCIDLQKTATGEDAETFYYDEYQGFEKKGGYIKVHFKKVLSYQAEIYTIDLPLNILFEPDFKDRLKIQFDEAKEFARLQLEKIKLEEEESKKRFEIIKLKELMEKYPDIVDEITKN